MRRSVLSPAIQMLSTIACHPDAQYYRLAIRRSALSSANKAIKAKTYASDEISVLLIIKLELDYFRSVVVSVQ
ncbi:hypothetical protein BgiBS90_027339 [Biomphalaria glabrata]|nr:hypothetical protein BgiBS90_027339 [Biomphalaria glabrata]